MINKDNSIASRIEISCKKVGARTSLADSSFDIPYKVVHYGSKLLQDHLEIMLMCYSPGVMDGDSLQIQVHCAEKCEMKLFTQSFNKLHPMKSGARQLMNIEVGEQAIFQYLPQPTIPFKDSIFDAENIIRLEKDAHLIWGDIISGGRIYSGERFEFSRIHNKTKVYHKGKLIFFDNQLMAPKKQPIEKILFFEGYTHQGTLLIVSEMARAFKQELDEVLTEQFVDMSYGFTMCGENALLVRALGESGDAMHEWLANIGDMCWSFIKHRTAKEKPAVRVRTTQKKSPAKKAKSGTAPVKKSPAKRKPRETKNKAIK